MIVGNGLIAKALQKIDAPEMVFFASGVSNSLETNKTAFEREVNLLKKENQLLKRENEKLQISLLVSDVIN